MTARLDGIQAITFDFGNTLVPVGRAALGRVVEDPDRLAPVAPTKTRWAAIPAALSVALPVVRVVLPHIAAALAPPSRR